MGNLTSKKKNTDEDNISYYTISSYNGKHASDVYKIMDKKYPDHKIFILSNPSTVMFVNRTKTVFIYCEYEGNIVTSIDVYC